MTFMKNRNVFLSHMSNILQTWTLILAETDQLTAARIAEVYCVRFTVLHQVLIETREIEFSSRLIEKNTGFGEPLSPEFESYLINIITHLVNLIINRIEDLQPLER